MVAPQVPQPPKAVFPSEAEKPPWSIGGRNYVLILLTLVAAINFLDRQILSVLLEPIKAEFGLPDWALGVLTGIGFAAFYATLGIPIAALADRFNRRNIIVVCTGLFSVMTALCGLAQNFWHLFLARIGVGVGEAGTMPASQSIISNLFPTENRAAAMGLLATGGNIGLMLGMLIGGFVNDWWGWRWAFAVAAMPGVLLALSIWLTVKEPVRPKEPAAAAEARQHIVRGILKSLSTMSKVPSIRWFTIGGSLYGLTGYGLYTFMAPYYMRYHEYSTSEAGVLISIMTGVLGATGTFAGGVVCAKLATRFGLHWNGWVPAMAILLSAPFMITMLLTDNTWLAVCLFVVPGFLSSVYAGPTWAIIQELVTPAQRAMAASVYMLLFNLIALGLGPVYTGAVSSAIEPAVGDQSLRYAMASVVVISLIGAFAYVMAARRVTGDVSKVRAAQERTDA